MARGNALIEYAADDNKEAFMNLFLETCKNDKEKRNMMFWHVQNSFKEALKHKSLMCIEYMIEDLHLDLKHECFGNNLLHKFIHTCSMAERYDDEDMKEVNRQVLRYLVQGMNREIDSMDSLNGSTALHLACQLLSDLVIIEILLDGGAHVNPVRNDNMMPLGLIRERLEKDPENYDLIDIEIKLVQKGAKEDWRK